MKCYKEHNKSLNIIAKTVDTKLHAAAENHILLTAADNL